MRGECSVPHCDATSMETLAESDHYVVKLTALQICPSTAEPERSVCHLTG
jgi:hypothetical protein